MKKRNILFLAALPFLLVAPGRATEEKTAPFMGRNFAHRGLHKQDQTIPENSMRAFGLAAEKGYGIELDVQLTKDGQVVVFHDDTLERMCGVNARVDEFTFADLQNLKLAGSSEDKIPLFSDVLVLVNGRSPMIVELKSGPRKEELCEKTLKLLESYKGDTCVESFDPSIVTWFRFHAPKMLRGQLTMNPESYSKLSLIWQQVLGNSLANIMARPQFIAHQISEKAPLTKLSEKMGAMRICWTSHDPSNEEGNDAVIFEYYEPKPKYR
ncbi:MAG: glycerophosphodiester phosphodiesterase [Acetatifactor sp.]|nr:glycerophosphodiester phosphodiesterase [Acetatifactor sp.]